VLKAVALRVAVAGESDVSGRVRMRPESIWRFWVGISWMTPNRKRRRSLVLFGNREHTADWNNPLASLIGPWFGFTAETVHTATMTLKNAATLALIGTHVLTVLLAIDFVNSFLALARGLIPAMAVLRILIYLFASLTVTEFFYVFTRAQSR
jgi:hypothetical protein